MQRLPKGSNLLYRQQLENRNEYYCPEIIKALEENGASPLESMLALTSTLIAANKHIIELEAKVDELEQQIKFLEATGIEQAEQIDLAWARQCHDNDQADR